MATVAALLGGQAQAQDPDRRDDLRFQTDVFPLLTQFCGGCHGDKKAKGDLSFTGYAQATVARLMAEAHRWDEVAERISEHEMPPDGEPQPSAEQRDRITRWIEANHWRALQGLRPDPGRVTVRRLNRTEYNNTIRDLFGVDLKPAQDFPSDDIGYGFDNIGDVLSLPPVLVERYLAAADEVVNRVIVGELIPRRRSVTLAARTVLPHPAASRVRGQTLVMTQAGVLRARHDFTADGDYLFTLQLAGSTREAVLRLDGQVVPPTKTAVWRARRRVEAGSRWVELAFEPTRAAHQLRVQSIRIEGPLSAEPRRLPASHLRLIPHPPPPGQERQEAREILARFLPRAYRRPIAPEEVTRLMRFVEEALGEGEPFERAMQRALRAALTSPHFLFRIERNRSEPDRDGIAPLDDFSLASRLSYFLWSSLPDDELFAAAAAGNLHQPEILAAEVRRMLADARSAALVENFATQWLQLRTLARFNPNRSQYPQFDDNLRAALMKETDLFFSEVMRQDLPLVTFLNADFTFLNERLAQHYGIPEVKGADFRRVNLTASPRGGLLTMGSVLAVTSNPTRTSPVKRGRWVLEQILGTPPPPPPPGVPELKDEGKKGPLSAHSVRALMEQHRSAAACAVCHQKMDPLGFGLENFDVVGAWRTRDGDQPIDASGSLPGGVTFNGPVALKQLLTSKLPAFRRTITSRMLTYALGRGLETSDLPTVDRLCHDIAQKGDRFSQLVVAVTSSVPFQQRRMREATP